MKHQKDMEEHQAAVLNHFKTTPHVPPFPGRPGHHRHDFRCPPGQSPGSLVMPPPPMTCQFSPPAHPPPPSKVGRLQMLGGRWGHGWDHSFIPPPAPPAPLICSLPPPVPTPLNCNMPLPPPPVVNCNMPPLPVPVGECLTNDAAKARRHGLAISNEKQQQTDGASSAERSTSTDPASVQVVHPGVLCDSCGDLVMGVRYKCGNCRDFDLCEKCEAKTTHDASHMFIKIRNPCKVPIRVPMLSQVYEPLKLHINSPRGAAAENVPSMPSTAKEAAAKWDQFLAGVATAAAATKGKLVGEVARASTSAEPAEDKQPEPATAAEAPQVNETTKYAAHFVEDVTIPDGTAVGAGEPFVKIWSVANMSEYEWPQGTMLVHMDGEPTIPGRKKAVAVIVGKRYEQIGVAVDLVAPEKPGKYISKWRLMTPTGQYFGSGLWCSIAVPEDASASPAVDSVPQLAICPAKPEDIGTSPDIDSFPRLAICPAKPEDKGKEVETASEASSAPVSVSASISASETSSSKSVSDIVSVLSSKPASVAASADDEEDAVVVDVVAEPEVAAKTEEAVDERAVPELTKTKSMSVAPSEALSTSESIASLTNTFVQISADLMKEIQRLDSSIKEIQAKQSANENKQPFDITSAPNLSSETPIKSYPTATPPRTFTNVDLLTSPPITFAQTHPLVQPSAPPMIGTSRHASAPDAMSEHSSVREFLASTDRLDRLVGSTRQSDPVSPFYTHSGSPAGGNPFHQSASDNGHDEFEFVNDFTPHFAKHNHHHNH
ncbi:hypothetical protein FBU59_002164 [Linderina macrospora]|uniref:Uncharacterized protein n=1 Tax=Linderina macrospora TaxID=4868 RepID=A0ACC1JC54_9FUNG|nr:hypothetical protein FBU59_002164 [Linderina macrospora]